MPNILAHSYVTAEVKGESLLDINLGSTLPDFVGMYRDYIGEFVKVNGLDMALDIGVDFHVQTDITYDRQPEKHRISAPLAVHLAQVGLKPSAARLGAAFLADIIVDGALVRQDEPCRAFIALAEHVVGGDSALTIYSSIPPDFAEYVMEYFRRGLPTRYSEPEALAAMLQDRLYRRAKTEWAQEHNTFETSQIANVAEVIDLQADRIGPLGEAALKRTIETLIA